METTNNSTVVISDKIKINLNQYRVKDSNVGAMSESRMIDRIGQTIGMLIAKSDQIGHNINLTRNNKIQALGDLLKTLSKIGQESSDLLVEVLLDKYDWISPNNAQLVASKIIKLGKLVKSDVNSLDLPAGWTCPKANLCKSKSDMFTGQIKDFGQFRCYACNHESQYDNTRVSRWFNFLVLLNSDYNTKVEVLDKVLNQTKVLRLSSSGDLFNQDYFNALVEVCQKNPNKIVFGYTKILEYALKAKDIDNLYLIYSVGGCDDMQAMESDINKSIVHVEHIDESVCQIHDDIFSQGEDFIKILIGQDVHLNLHGTQPAK